LVIKLVVVVATVTVGNVWKKEKGKRPSISRRRDSYTANCLVPQQGS